jgi:hypothetical protein
MNITAQLQADNVSNTRPGQADRGSQWRWRWLDEIMRHLQSGVLFLLCQQEPTSSCLATIHSFPPP